MHPFFAKFLLSGSLLQHHETKLRYKCLNILSPLPQPPFPSLTFHSALAIVLWGSQVFGLQLRLYFWPPLFYGFWLPGMIQVVEFSGFSDCRRGFSVHALSAIPLINTYLHVYYCWFWFQGEPTTTGCKSSEFLHWLGKRVTTQEDWQSHSQLGPLRWEGPFVIQPNVGVSFLSDLCWCTSGDHSWFCDVLLVEYLLFKGLILLGYPLLETAGVLRAFP